MLKNRLGVTEHLVNIDWTLSENLDYLLHILNINSDLFDVHFWNGYGARSNALFSFTTSKKGCWYDSFSHDVYCDKEVIKLKHDYFYIYEITIKREAGIITDIVFTETTRNQKRKSERNITSEEMNEKIKEAISEYENYINELKGGADNDVY